MTEEQKDWKKQRTPSSLRQIASTLDEIKKHLVKESEEMAARAEHVAKEALKQRA